MTPDLPLTRLAAFVRQQTIAPEPLTGIGGTVSDVSRSSIAVRGLSRDARLGDTVAIRAGEGAPSLAEIIRVADLQVLVKPFDDRIMPSLGQRFSRKARCASARRRNGGAGSSMRLEMPLTERAR